MAPFLAQGATGCQSGGLRFQAWTRRILRRALCLGTSHQMGKGSSPRAARCRKLDAAPGLNAASGYLAVIGASASADQTASDQLDNCRHAQATLPVLMCSGGFSEELLSPQRLSRLIPGTEDMGAGNEGSTRCCSTLPQRPASSV